MSPCQHFIIISKFKKPKTQHSHYENYNVIPKNGDLKMFTFQARSFIGTHVPLLGLPIQAWCFYTTPTPLLLAYFKFNLCCHSSTFFTYLFQFQFVCFKFCEVLQVPIATLPSSFSLLCEMSTLSLFHCWYIPPNPFYICFGVQKITYLWSFSTFNNLLPFSFSFQCVSMFVFLCSWPICIHVCLVSLMYVCMFVCVDNFFLFVSCLSFL